MYLLDIWKLWTVVRSARVVECLASPGTEVTALKLRQIPWLGRTVILEP